MPLRIYLFSLIVITAAILNLVEVLRIFTFWWMPTNLFQFSVLVFDPYQGGLSTFTTVDQADVNMGLLMSFSVLLVTTVISLGYSISSLYYSKGGIAVYAAALLAWLSLSDMWLYMRIDWFPIMNSLNFIQPLSAWWGGTEYGLPNITDLVSFIAGIVLFIHARQYPLFDFEQISSSSTRSPRPAIKETNPNLDNIIKAD